MPPKTTSCWRCTFRSTSVLGTSISRCSMCNAHLKNAPTSAGNASAMKDNPPPGTSACHKAAIHPIINNVLIPPVQMHQHQRPRPIRHRPQPIRHRPPAVHNRGANHEVANVRGIARQLANGGMRRMVDDEKHQRPRPIRHRPRTNRSQTTSCPYNRGTNTEVTTARGSSSTQAGQWWNATHG